MITDVQVIICPQKQEPIEDEKLCVYLIETALNKLPPGTEEILGIFDLRGFRVENGDVQFLKFLVTSASYCCPFLLVKVVKLLKLCHY